MRKKRSVFRLILLFILVAVIGLLFYKNFETKKELDIKKWDNIYNEENIALFYEDNKNIENNKSLKELDKVYKVRELTSKGTSEIDKVLKCIDILKNIVEYDEVADGNLIDGYEILKAKDTSKKVCGREMAIIARDLIITSGYKCRVGEFRSENPQLSKSPSYYVVEYFSEEDQKWVMIDFKHRAYYLKDKKKLSAIEILNNKYSDLKYKGRSKFDDVKNDFKRYLSSYTIAIDNTLKMEKSNSYLTYISSKKDIDLKKGNKYISPTIFTENTDLFLKSPNDGINSEDDSAYLIMMKKQVDTKENNLEYVIGAFKNDSVINNYYIKINGDDWKQVKNFYYDNKIKTGDNTIELSLDGKTSIRKIIINKKE